MHDQKKRELREGRGGGIYAGSVKQLQNVRKILFGRKESKVQFERNISTKDKYIRTYFVDIKCDVINWIRLAGDVD